CLIPPVPCAPANPSTIHDCSSNVIVFGWQATNNTLYYIATAVDNTGKATECRTQDNMCFFTNTGCGQFYKYTVYAVSSECNSEVTHPEFVRTCEFDLSGLHLVHFFIVITDFFLLSTNPMKRAHSRTPCLPTNIKTAAECHSETLITTWDSAAGALSYTVEAQGNTPLHCNSTETLCTTGGLLCGSSYIVTVLSVTGTCFSLPSTEVTVQTLPCPPTNVTVTHTCAPGSVPVSWVASDSAIYYTAVAVSGGGHRSECTTNTTTCSLPGLQCGEVYTIGVSGGDDNCTGQLSDTVSLNRGKTRLNTTISPCSPTNVSSQLVCSAGIAHVSWAPSANAVKYAMKATSNEQILSCTSSTPNCTLTDLVCGQLYDIVVTSTDGTCVSGYSVVPHLITHLLTMTMSLTAVTDCGTNSLLASWNAAPGATSYTATVTGPNGFSETCFSSNLTCSFSSLQCASQYNITVTSQDSNCTSSPSQTVLTTGPCDPVNVTSIYQCGSDKATVSWEAAAGAVAYTVHAQEGSSQHYSSCRSNTTSCQLNQLQCGKVYNLTVMAEDATCNSTGDISTTLMTGRTEEHWTDSITAQGSQCDSAPSSSTNITTCECVHGCERKLSISVKNNFLLIPSGKPTFLFLLLSVQPPVLQLTYLSNMCVAPAQQCSVGLTLWDASASWLRLQEKGIRIAARLQIPAVRSKVSLVVWV
uniref:Fibronectin type-III domain-containing protein n=1 Tax=Dicentrarchus labrax TaxID=13489 RepID=A0A8C4ISQ4_DICLA